MNAEAKSTSTELTLIERAQVALQSHENERKLKDLAASTKDITAITNTDGYKQCHSMRMALKSMRVYIEKMAKAARQDATDFQKACVAEQNRLVGIIDPEERRLDQMQSAWDAEREREKQAKLEAERKRVNAIRERIDEIRQRPADAAGQSAAEIELYVTNLVRLQIDDSFAELKSEAEAAKETALVRLRSAHTKAIAFEDQQAEQRAESERLARERVQQDRLNGIRGRIQAISAQSNGCTLKSAADLSHLIAAVRRTVIDESYCELRAEAQEALESVVRQLEQAHAGRVAANEENARLEAERERQREQERLGQMRMEEIQGIQHQVMIATSGRLGVRRGGTRECIVDTLAETEAWPITEDNFGILFGGAQRVKEKAIEQIRLLLTQWDERAESERVANERRIALAVDEQRIADERSALEAEKARAAEPTPEPAPSPPSLSTPPDSTTLVPRRFIDSQLEEACDVIDAALFSGDDFLNPDAVARLEWYMARWQRGIAELCEP